MSGSASARSFELSLSVSLASDVSSKREALADDCIASDMLLMLAGKMVASGGCGLDDWAKLDADNELDIKGRLFSDMFAVLIAP